MSATNAGGGDTEPAGFPVPGDTRIRPPRRAGKPPSARRRFAACRPVRASTEAARPAGQARSCYQTRPGPRFFSETPGPGDMRWGRWRIGGAAAARRLSAGLLAGALLLAGSGAAQAQDETLWTAELIVSSNPGGGWDFGYFSFGNGSLTPNSFTYDGNSFSIDVFAVAETNCINAMNDVADELVLMSFRGTDWGKSDRRWVLHIDSHTLDFPDADELSGPEISWCDISAEDLGWADGDTVDVKVTRRAATPITVPDGHPVIWQAEITPESNSGQEGWSGFSSSLYGSLTGPVSFEYKSGSYEVARFYTASGNAYVELKSGSASGTELAHSNSNLSLHVGSEVLAMSDASGGATVILWLSAGVTWPSNNGVIVGISTSEPGAPGDLSATAASATWVTLGWSEPEKTGGSAITGYEYRRSADEGENWGSWTSIPKSASLRSFVVTGLHADTTYTFQMRAVNDSGSGLHSETALQQPGQTAFAAVFEDMPDAHDGVTEFKFGLTFSEEPRSLGYLAVRDYLFDITRGEIVGVSRRDRGSNRRWRITVEPHSMEAVTIELPVRRNCHLANAPCTADGRPLSGAVADTVAGPAAPSVSVADASASEGDSVVFTVSLSVATGEQVTVAYATAGGTATSGTDFTAEDGTLAFAAGVTEKTVSVSTTEDAVEEGNETFTLTLSSPAGATLGVAAAATGTIVDDDAAQAALTATFGGMPGDHSGAAFTFALTFSEEIEGLSYVTLRDSAFVVSGGDVKRARRQEQGKNKAWTITVRPDAATATVAITLPATTDCTASGAICTADNRKLSAAVSDTVVPASSSSDMAGGDMANADAEEDALTLLDGVSPEAASAALFGERTLSDAQLDALDRLGNRNGRYDLGDMLSWTDRCRSGEASCGSTPRDAGAASSALLPFGAAATARRLRSGRTGRRGSRRRRARGSRLAVLLAAAAAWSCGGDLVEPSTAGREPGAPAAELPAPAAIPRGPGFLTVEWTAPAGRAAGVLLELDGPGITAFEPAAGLDLYRSAAPGRHRIVVAGPLPENGPLVRFRVPDRGRLALYRVRVLQVTGEDYALGDPGEYRAVAGLGAG
ncbi:MAG: hypothetical protein F4037_00395 [Gemmatimonadales bacterium]|nr:hypothetical protein [Candidatus Palauibacter ramosifaciens]